jgi:CDP-diacylglycerol--glycerol-3-phosphate 3-phosphatidyltransferase
MTSIKTVTSLAREIIHFIDDIEINNTPRQHFVATMKYPMSLIAGMSVLLSSSVMSSSFSPAVFGRATAYAKTKTAIIRADRMTLFLRGGGDDDSIVSGSSIGSASISSNNSGGEAVILSAVANGGGEADEAKPVSSSKVGTNAPPPGPLRRLFPKFPWHELPNYLTYARCISIPIFLLLSYYPVNMPNRAPVLSILFALASITDWFDGFLARRWGVTSPFGAFLDPVADKLMVSTALIVLAGRYGGIVAIPAAIIMAREVGVSALREWMAQRGARDSVKVGMQGKIKAALTMVSITLMLLVPEGVGLESVSWTKYLGVLGAGGAGSVIEGVVNDGFAWMLGPSLLMLFASAFVTVTSGSVYFRAAAPVLLGKE